MTPIEGAIHLIREATAIPVEPHIGKVRCPVCGRELEVWHVPVKA